MLILEKGAGWIRELSHWRPGSQLCQLSALFYYVWLGRGWSFSDGKLTLTTEFGGWLQDYVGKEKLQSLIDYADSIYVKFGAPDRVFGQDSEKIEDLRIRSAKAGLKLIPARIRHMGTENTIRVLKNIYDDLKSSCLSKPWKW